ncbi:putative mediator of RNA polymerase II transcription subunit 26 isoform X2 [Folsomia candida]|uniref:putative mediator of RNA polymerase II transcription subunit 26 isoform X2 n=1 Tax=Folsomia candida TaxID=158441 RepID=UPI001604B7B4|nr:putative mediator of RNA polymerase II transcription subunit 26 isoform X2 [Folsomia candida]
MGPFFYFGVILVSSTFSVAQLGLDNNNSVHNNNNLLTEEDFPSSYASNYNNYDNNNLPEEINSFIGSLFEPEVGGQSIGGGDEVGMEQVNRGPIPLEGQDQDASASSISPVMGQAPLTNAVALGRPFLYADNKEIQNQQAHPNYQGWGDDNLNYVEQNQVQNSNHLDEQRVKQRRRKIKRYRNRVASTTPQQQNVAVASPPAEPTPTTQMQHQQPTQRGRQVSKSYQNVQQNFQNVQQNYQPVQQNYQTIQPTPHRQRQQQFAQQTHHHQQTVPTTGPQQQYQTHQQHQGYNHVANNYPPQQPASSPQKQKSYRQHQPLNQYYGNTFNYAVEPQQQQIPTRQVVPTPPKQHHHHHHQQIPLNKNHPQNYYTQESRQLPQYQPRHQNNRQRHAHNYNQHAVPHPQQTVHHHHLPTQQWGGQAQLPPNNNYQPIHPRQNYNNNHPQFQPEAMQPAMSNPRPVARFGHRSGRGNNYYPTTSSYTYGGAQRSRATYSDDADDDKYYTVSGYSPTSGGGYSPSSDGYAEYDEEPVAEKRRKKKKSGGGKKAKAEKEKEDAAKEESFIKRGYTKTKNVIVNTASAVFGAPKFIYTRYKKAYNNLGSSKKRSSKVAAENDREYDHEEGPVQISGGGGYVGGGGGAYGDDDAEQQWRLHARQDDDSMLGGGRRGWAADRSPGRIGTAVTGMGADPGPPQMIDDQNHVNNIEPCKLAGHNHNNRMMSRSRGPNSYGERTGGGGRRWQNSNNSRGGGEERLLSLPSRPAWGRVFMG